MLKDQWIACRNHCDVALRLVKPPAPARNDQLNGLQTPRDVGGGQFDLLKSNQSFYARSRPKQTHGLWRSPRRQIPAITVPSVKDESHACETITVVPQSRVGPILGTFQGASTSRQEFLCSNATSQHEFEYRNECVGVVDFKPLRQPAGHAEPSIPNVSQALPAALGFLLTPLREQDCDCERICRRASSARHRHLRT
jgi:hypothetical protein